MLSDFEVLAGRNACFARQCHSLSSTSRGLKRARQDNPSRAHYLLPLTVVRCQRECGTRAEKGPAAPSVVWHLHHHDWGPSWIDGSFSALRVWAQCTASDYRHLRMHSASLLPQTRLNPCRRKQSPTDRAISANGLRIGLDCRLSDTHAINFPTRGQ